MDSIFSSSIKSSIDRVVKGTARYGRGDSKFFSTTKKGEISDLRADLNSNDKYRITEAVKKVIASMTVGKDVSALFTDVVKSLATDQLELKKLVYLYVINYARTSPDKAILVVNTFQKDASSASPLIRALAIRTMGCIRVERITEYLAEPLQRALKDKDPYVRKTAAIAVCKLHDIAPDLVIDQNFIPQLKELLNDSNPMVVANAVAALQDISVTSGVDVFKIDTQLCTKLLSALNECTEWGQIFILDAIAQYQPKSKREAEDTIERVTPRLKHANAAVVMSAIRVIVNYLPHIDRNNKLYDSVINDKLPPPLITLLSDVRPEIQYVALRNIRLLIAKLPALLNNAIKHFFVKYNDPIYVKMEKLDILLALSNSKNIDKVLAELREYASEIDVEFVRRAVNCIGRCAIKIESCAEKAVQLLLELISMKVQYVVQECIVVIRDIFRRYPNRYESIISTLCDHLEQLDEPDARGSIIWIIGEYAEKIDNATELLDNFVSSWSEEVSTVQLTLLTAVVKLFLKRPEDAKILVGKVLQIATNDTDNPDLRDRAYIYWRLLATDPEQAQHVVLASKPAIADDYFNIDDSTLDQLIQQIGTLASVYHKQPQYFVAPIHRSINAALLNGSVDEEEETETVSDDDNDNNEYSDEDVSSDTETEQKTPNTYNVKPRPQSNEIDLLGLMGNDTAAPTTPPIITQSIVTSTPSTTTSSKTTSHDPFVTVLSADKGSGLSIRTRVARRNNVVSLDMYLDNNSGKPLSQWAIKFNENYVGIEPSQSLTPGTVQSGSSKPYALPLSETKQPVPNNIGIVQVAIKTELGVFYWNQSFNAAILFTDDGRLSDTQFLQSWKSLPDTNEQTIHLNNSVSTDVNECTVRLESRNVYVIATRIINQQLNTVAIYASCRYKQATMLIELKLDASNTTIAVRSEATQYNNTVLYGIQQLLT